MSQKHLLPLTALSALLLSPTALFAAERTWATGTVGLWSDPAAWIGGVRPSAVGADGAHLTTGGTTTLTGNQGYIATFGVGNTDGVTQGHLIIDSTGYLRVGSGGASSSIRAGSTVEVSGTLSALSGGIFNVGSSAGAGTVIIKSGGVFEHLGNDGTSTQLRLGVSGGTATVTADGGAFKASHVLTLGRSNNATATVTLKNGGSYTAAASGNINFGAINAGTQYTGVTATLNIGGETLAQGAGTISGVTRMNGYGATNTNTLNFNHTSSRYEFVDTATSNGIELRAAIAVNVLSGVTVFNNAASNYSRGTTIHNGAVLLANHRAFDEYSSTGNGAVTVNEGGTLAGLGWVNGATVVSGTLKPGDYDYGRPAPLYGTLRFRDSVTLTSTATLEMALGTDAERGVTYTGITLSGGGLLTLDGTLRLTLTDSFLLAEGETAEYQLFASSGGFTNNFSAFDLPDTWGGFDLQWDLSQLTTTGWATVTAIPEPSSLLLLAGGGVAALLAARRRRR